MKKIIGILILIFTAHFFLFWPGPTISHAGSYPKGISLGAVIWAPHSLSEKQLEFVAKNFQSVILGESDASLAKAADLKHFNPNLIILGYLNSRELGVGSSHYYEECNPIEDLYAHDIYGNRIKNVISGAELISTPNPLWRIKLISWIIQRPDEIDGVYLDMAKPTIHKPFYSAVPAGYTEEADVQSMKDIFADIKSGTTGLVIFNGLREGLKYEGYTDNVDGGVMENFIFHKVYQELVFSRFYEYVSALIEARKKGKSVGVCAESYKENIQNRIFALASYLLGASEYSTYNFTDIDYELSGSSTPYFYPEYEIELGDPLGQPDSIDDLLDSKTELYLRYYENGGVVVNPWENDILFSFTGSYKKVIPQGGGPVGLDGIPTGYLTYETISSPVMIEGKSAMILINPKTSSEISPPTGLMISGL